MDRHLEVEALDVGEGLQDLGGHGGGQHVNTLRVCGIWMTLLPVEEHPPTEQSSQLVTCEHLPPRDTPATQGDYVTSELRL